MLVSDGAYLTSRLSSFREQLQPCREAANLLVIEKSLFNDDAMFKKVRACLSFTIAFSIHHAAALHVFESVPSEADNGAVYT
jgi:hypothetical protein